MRARKVLQTAMLMVAVVPLAGCDTSDSTRRHAQLNELFTLAVDDSAFLDDAKLRVTFDDVVSDSRCPVEMLCQVAGFVAIELTVSSSGQAPEDVTLTTETLPDSRAVYQGFLITLERVDPLPHVNTTIRRADYRVTL